ncbi:DNA binding protein [Colletotrichum tofieldiae]|nr:DNA binding protein [Colletotrichum tofieldiae]
MSAAPGIDPAVFEHERARVGDNWEGYFASHPDLRDIPGLVFRGNPGEPVSRGGWEAFGLFFDGVTIPSQENRLRVAENARNYFQVLHLWLTRVPAQGVIDQNFLTAFGNDYAQRYSKDPQVCSSEDQFIVIITFIEARKEAIGRLFDPSGFQRLLDFLDLCIRDTKDRTWNLPPRARQVIGDCISFLIPDFEAKLISRAAADLSQQDSVKRKAPSIPEQGDESRSKRTSVVDNPTQVSRRPGGQLEPARPTVEQLEAEVDMLRLRVESQEANNREKARRMTEVNNNLEQWKRTYRESVEMELENCQADLEQSQAAAAKLWEILRVIKNKELENMGLRTFRWGPNDIDAFVRGLDRPGNVHRDG